MTQNSRSAPVLSLSGLTVDQKFVIVGVTVGIGGSTRFSTLKIPLVNLLHDDVINALDDAARRRLNAKWDRAFHQTSLFDASDCTGSI